MKTKKVLFWTLSLLSLALTLAALPFLPDQIPAHYDIHNQVTRWGSKYETLIIPAMNLLTTLILWAVMKYTAKHEENGSNNAQVCLIAGIFSAVVFDGMTIYFLYTDFHQVENLSQVALDINQVVLGLLAIFLIVIGNVMPKVRMNGLLGLRTPWSMKNEAVWKKCQRFGGICSIVCGAAMLLICLRVRGAACFGWSMGLLAAMCIADVVYSWYAAEKQ